MLKVFVKLFIILSVAVLTLFFAFVFIDDEKLAPIRKSLIFHKDRENSSCGRYPVATDITIDNLIWQVLQIESGFVKILNAYDDKRPFLVDNEKSVRINVASVSLNSNNTFYCQFWYENLPDPVVVKATSVLLMWRKGFFI